ncbi:hypothetical protein BX616_009086 [Lobosporangium transversale]|nr:hypothetical protein BX616_009086 [Lobosporangium transversale]
MEIIISEMLNRFQHSSAGISSLIFGPSIDSLEHGGPRLIVGSDDSALYEIRSVRESIVQVEREYVGYDLDGPAHARLVGGGPAVIAVAKEGGLLRFGSGTQPI